MSIRPKAAVAHLWFVTIHPFENGNGRITRAVAHLALARLDGSAQRIYSMSSQIRLTRAVCYDTVERTQKRDLDISRQMVWFLGCLQRAITGTQRLLGTAVDKARFCVRAACQLAVSRPEFAPVCHTATPPV